VHKLGRPVWVGETATLLESPGGEPLYFLSHVEDIGERRRAEGALLESAARYRALFENMSNGVVIYAPAARGTDFIFADLNKAAERIDGIRRKEVVGKSLLSVFPRAKEFGLFDVLQRVWRTGKPEQHPVTKYVDQRIEGWRQNFVYKLPSGEIVAVFTDETQRKQLEEKLQEQTHQLQERVKELDCLYAISQLVEPEDRSLTEIIQGVVNLMPQAWEYPAITCAKAVIEGREFATENYQETVWKQAADITAQEKTIGTLAVYYLEERPQRDEGPFLKYERHLLDAVAGRLGRIVQLRRARAELRITLEHLREMESIINRSPAIAFLWRAQEGWPVEFVSENISQFGYTQEDFLSGAVRYADIVHPDDLDRVAEEVARYSREGLKTFTQEYRIITRSGEARWLDDRTLVRRDSTGSITHYQGIILDITDRKQAEEARLETEERFRAIFEGARDCIFIKDRQSRYTHVNPAVEKVFGISASEIIGRRAEEVFDETTGKQITEGDARVLAGESIESEYSGTFKGVWLAFHVSRVPLRNSAGEIVGICSISRNITERRRAIQHRRITMAEFPSKAMRDTLARAKEAAASDTIVLLLGERGSGKGRLAQWIHAHSRRAAGALFPVNCAALPQAAAESEMFGHEPEAFPVSRPLRKGLLELAEGGTLLLNEIGELAPALQSKLLSFVDTGSFLRVGGENPVHVNARLIAATRRNLEVEVAAGRFLPALFHRLKVFPLYVPRLRERQDDLPVLAQEILSDLASEMQLSRVPTLSASLTKALISYDWPGNVRELRNVLERGLILWKGGDFRLNVPPLDDEAAWAYRVPFPSSANLDDVTGQVSAAFCAEALRRSGGSKAEAARLLGISRYRLNKHLKF